MVLTPGISILIGWAMASGMTEGPGAGCKALPFFFFAIEGKLEFLLVFIATACQSLPLRSLIQCKALSCPEDTFQKVPEEVDMLN
jgi:hypothetical protein